MKNNILKVFFLFDYGRTTLGKEKAYECTNYHVYYHVCSVISCLFQPIDFIKNKIYCRKFLYILLIFSYHYPSK